MRVKLKKRKKMNNTIEKARVREKRACVCVLNVRSRATTTAYEYSEIKKERHVKSQMMAGSNTVNDTHNKTRMGREMHKEKKNKNESEKN